MPKGMKKTEIKQDLLDQLERNGTVGKYYIDLVNDYMSLWETKKKLIADIKERGVSIKWETYNKDGEVVQSGRKKNESVDQLVKVNQQMLKLLDALGIKPSQDGDGDDPDLEM